MGIFDREHNFWEKILAIVVLAAGEMFGVSGYGLTDAYTFLSGVIDLRQKLLLRGGLKIAGALIPFVPSFWVVPVADWLLAVKETDKIVSYEKEISNTKI